MKHKIFFINIYILSTVLLIVFNNINAYELHKDSSNINNETINYTVTVLDKNSSAPMPSVVIFLKEGNSIIAKSVTNAFGRALFNDLQNGTYEITTHYVGYNDFTDKILVDSLHRSFEIRLIEKNIELSSVEVEGDKINKVATSIDLVTGRQIFEGETYHAPPASQMTQLVQQNLAGAVRASTGEVHIRGQHGEFTYLIDGIPIPLGVFGGLNEIVDSKIISRMTFYTGGFPAEFGGQITGIMDVNTRVPTGQFHLDFSSYIGSYLTSNSDSLGSRVGTLKAINSNGQSLSFSGHAGKLGYYIATSRQETDRRIDQPVSQLFHDKGFDYFFYGKFDYLLSDNDYLTANINFSSTQTQVPYDPIEGYLADDQHSYNAFQTLSLFHTISSVPDNESNLFIGVFAREGGLKFTPNAYDNNRVYLNNDTTQSYVVDQDRTFATFGVRTKYDQNLSHHFNFAIGMNVNYTTGNGSFRFFNSSGDKQVLSNDFMGSDIGAFIQSQWHPLEWTRLDFGIRYDIHNAPALSNQYQISPRLKWNFFIDELNSISISYSHLFMPTNIENLGAIASQLGNNSLPTLPEKDDLYEISYMKNWNNGFNSKLAGFYKQSSPGLDDQSLGSSTIRVNVNIAEIEVTGIELALTYNDLSSPFSAYLNVSLIHAYGTGPVSGGFLPSDPNTNPFDLDHDQRLSAVLGLNYQPAEWFINLTAIYGSGLTNGNSNYSFKTGLFDFNQRAHTTPSWIINISAGYKFDLGNNQSLEPSIYITNLLDHDHLIKGVFFSGASFEERRNLVLKISYHL